MGYQDWFEKHSQKHKAIVDKLLSKDYSDDEIIEYFSYDNMVQNEIEFCPLYKQNKKCHEMDNLNCYLCGCPNFRFNDTKLAQYSGYTIKSKCDINNGETKAYNGIIHQNCSKCSVPHHKAYIKKHFDYDWKKIMLKCYVK